MYVLFLILVLLLLKYTYTSQNVMFRNVSVNNGTTEEKMSTSAHLKELQRRSRVLVEKIRESNLSNLPGMKRLVSKWNGNIEELNQLDLKTQKRILAYAQNKGEKVAICVKTPEGMNQLNEGMFVLLHEMAHVMTVEYSHNQEFWDNFKLLLQFAADHGLYRPRDYKRNPTPFCGEMLIESPLFS